MALYEEYTCIECRGSRMIQAPVSVGRICPRCNGKGSTDWIANAMGNRLKYEEPDHQLLYNLVMRNVDYLTTEIRQQGMQLGIMIDVKIEMRRESDFMNEYALQYQSQIIPK